MSISVRYKALLLVGATIVVALGGYVVLLRNMRAMERDYVAETRAAVEHRIATETEKINTYMATMQDGAASMASAGETLLLIRERTGANIAEEVNDLIMRTTARYPKAVGSGLWYEPYVFDTGRKYFGPYAWWDNGKVVLTMDYNTPEYDYVNQPWYTQAIPAGWDRGTVRPERVYQSAPFLDTQSDTLMITLGGVMYGPKGRIAGMSTLDVSIQGLRDAVADIRITPSSVAFAVDTRSGLIAAYPADSGLLLQSAVQLPFPDAEKMLAVPPGTSVQRSSSFNGTPYTIFYSVSPTGMGLGIAVPDAELFARADRLTEANTRATIGVAVALFLLFGLIVFALNRIIIMPLLSLASFSQSVAEGKLDTTAPDGFRSEFAVLRGAMVSMLDSLRAKMGEAERRAEESRDSAQQAETARREAEEATRRAESARREGMQHAALRLRDVVHVVSSASGDLSARIEESSNGAQAQSLRVAETASAVEELSASVLEIARNAETTATLSEQSRDVAGQGATEFSAVLRDVGAAHDGFQVVYTSVNELSHKADGIGAIAQTIEDIADQTNLLALNAAIEAARAGDAGRGFAVVADEVRKLAEKTMSATKEVGQSITAIQRAVRDTLSSMEGTRDTLAKSMTDVTQSEELLTRIVSLAMESSDQVRAIATAAEQQSSATEEINASVTDITRISEETSTAMQAAAQTVAQLGKQTGELAALIAELEQA